MLYMLLEESDHSRTSASAQSFQTRSIWGHLLSLACHQVPTAFWEGFTNACSQPQTSQSEERNAVAPAHVART